MKNYKITKETFPDYYDNAIVIESKEGKHLDEIDTNKWKPVTIGEKLKGKAYFYKSEKKRLLNTFAITYKNYSFITQYNEYYKGYFLVIF